MNTANDTSPRPPRRPKLGTSLSAHGEPMQWLTGGSLAVCVVMIVGLLLYVVVMGMSSFWPRAIQQVELLDGRVLLGEVTKTQSYVPDDVPTEDGMPDLADRAQAEMDANDGELTRRQLRTENYDLTNIHFQWVLDASIKEGSEETPEWALLLERTEWGRFYGYPIGFTIDGELVAETPEDVWQKYLEYHDAVRERYEDRVHLERHDSGEVSGRLETARLAVREVVLADDLPPAWSQAYQNVFDDRRDADDELPGAAERLADSVQQLERLESNMGRPSDDAVARMDEALAEYGRVADQAAIDNDAIREQIVALDEQNARYRMIMRTADGIETEIRIDEIVRAVPANQMGFGQKLGVYVARWWEFLTAEPREANTEGGVFPAIVGTVLMTLIMAVLVVPFGVTASLYLREYARSGPIVSAVRIAINNLAGVPSIVFGVFGLGFFCYGVGGFIDGGPAYAMPKGIWFIALGVLVLVAAAAFILMLKGFGRPGKRVSRAMKVMRVTSGFAWLFASIGAVVLIATTPFFDGFFQARMPNPTFGKGALIWASFTLALLTLPVVIVATEEALSAVPNSMREGSYACGASKWQTIKRIVLPRAMPGIMTGMILAMARGAGEVAPLMIVGAVKWVPDLPISSSPGEYFGVNRSFMHLGFHIYDLGFQSQNSEAAKPLVFTTTLLLIGIIAILNLAAIWLRSRLRRRFVGAQF